jgi:hypothetical protein
VLEEEAIHREEELEEEATCPCATRCISCETPEKLEEAEEEEETRAASEASEAT